MSSVTFRHSHGTCAWKVLQLWRVLSKCYDRPYKIFQGRARPTAVRDPGLLHLPGRWRCVHLIGGRARSFGLFLVGNKAGQGHRHSFSATTWRNWYLTQRSEIPQVDSSALPPWQSHTPSSAIFSWRSVTSNLRKSESAVNIVELLAPVQAENPVLLSRTPELWSEI